MVVRREAFAMLLAATYFAAGIANAATQINGEYQLMIDARKQDRAYEWDFDYNNNDTWTGAQFRVFATPRPGVEAFVKFEADYNPGNNANENPVFQYRESHARFKWDRNDWGADAFIFQRQNRFWIEKHLIEIVKPDNVKDGDNAQGARLDLWEPGGGNFYFLASDYSSQSSQSTGSTEFNPVGTDDAYVARLRRPFLDNRLRVGTTWNRKVEAEGADGDAHAGVVAGDIRWNVLGTDLLVEYADSYSRNVSEHVNGQWRDGTWKRLHTVLPGDVAAQIELRSVRLGWPQTGYLNIIPKVWYWGPNFVNPLGDGTRDEQGLFINSWYLVPERAITWSFNYTNWERFIFDQRKFTEAYVEMYTEYVNGFTSKFSYSHRKTRELADPEFATVTTNKDLFGEVQVESRLAWMRVQFKFKDLDTERQKELASVETSVNLTDKLKLYGRYTFGNDPDRLRKGLFTQLQYRPRGNMDVFLEYGPNFIGDTPNPVDDNDLLGSADNKDLVKLIVKGFF